MREILFRAKRLFNETWVYGGFVGEYDGYPIITSNDDQIYEVAPETVEQYIGLNDINGIKIFEGDVVSCMTKYGGDIGIVVFKDGKFMVYWQSEYHYPKCKKITDYYYVNARTKVVGNIYDNPELIGGTNNG